MSEEKQIGIGGKIFLFVLMLLVNLAPFVMIASATILAYEAFDSTFAAIAVATGATVVVLEIFAGWDDALAHQDMIRWSSQHKNRPSLIRE